ncbi:MAG: YIP1 family protein [Candidatus Margulisiibacteriota bacterium]
MSNVQCQVSNYCGTWWTILLRPIYFYSRLKEESWQKDATSFALITAWLIGFITSVIIFVLHYIPIGSTLTEKVAGLKFIFITPVLCMLALVFFLMTFMIISGLLVIGIFASMLGVGCFLHYAYTKMGGKGSLNRMFQCMLYSSAVLPVASLVLLFTLFTKYGGMDFSLFRGGYNFFYLLSLIYFYGLWAIAGRKVYGVSKWQAFAGAVIPALVLLIFGLMFDKIMLARLQPWIS